jgi:hypothetical protein
VVRLSTEKSYTWPESDIGNEVVHRRLGVAHRGRRHANEILDVSSPASCCPRLSSRDAFNVISVLVEIIAIDPQQPPTIPTMRSLIAYSTRLPI